MGPNVRIGIFWNIKIVTHESKLTWKPFYPLVDFLNRGVGWNDWNLQTHGWNNEHLSAVLLAIHLFSFTQTALECYHASKNYVLQCRKQTENSLLLPITFLFTMTILYQLNYKSNNSYMFHSIHHNLLYNSRFYDKRH